MKSLKIALGIALSTVGVDSGVAFGISNFASNYESQVTAEASGYILKNNYSQVFPLEKISGSNDKGQILNFYLKAGDEIAIFEVGDDTNPIGINYLSGGTAKSFFISATLSDYMMAIFGDESEGTYYNIYLNNAGRIYIDFAETKEVYFQVQDWDNTYVYSFDNTTSKDYESLIEDENAKIETFGGWPGKRVDTITNGVNFDGKGGIAKVEVPFAVLENTEIIFHNYSNTQTGNLILTEGAYYRNNASTGNSGDADLGSAAKVVYEIASEINNANNSSICNISSAKAGELYNLYNGLNSNAKAAVNNSTLWTYKSADMSQGNANISFADIANRLSLLSNKGSSSNFILPLSKNEYGTALLVSIISLLSVSIIVFFFIRRKRHQ